MAEAEYWRFTVARDCQKKNRRKDRTRKGLASALPGSGPKLVEDADALVLQETLTRFGLNSHHQRDLEVKRSEGPPAVDQAACHNLPTCAV